MTGALFSVCSGAAHRRGAPAISRRALLQGVAAVSLCGMGCVAHGQTAAPKPFSARVIQSGHSLTDPIVPVLETMVARAGGQAARGGAMARSTVPGSPMDWRWDHRNEYMVDARLAIADYDVLVITERAPLSGTIQWHDSPNVALRWYTHALTEGSGGAGAETILYATWVDIDSGPGFENPWNDPDGHLTFRERLPREMENWQSIADHVNAGRPDTAPPMRVIPGPLIMAAVHDSISEGQAPGIARIEDLFSDTIHLNDHGAYLIALAHFAVIYGRDPRDVPDGPGSAAAPAPETAAWMKELVHDVLRAYPDAGYAPEG